jgi:hypothetical protein
MLSSFTISVLDTAQLELLKERKAKQIERESEIIRREIFQKKAHNALLEGFHKDTIAELSFTNAFEEESEYTFERVVYTFKFMGREIHLFVLVRHSGDLAFEFGDGKQFETSKEAYKYFVKLCVDMAKARIIEEEEASPLIVVPED